MNKIIRFYDEDETYALIETDEKPEKIKELLNKYKEIDEYYDISGFLEWLKEQEVNFKTIPTEADVNIYF